MKRNLLFEKCFNEVSSEIKEEVSLNIDIANRIYDLIKRKNLTQREFARLMGKKESEISRWLTGSHGFTTTTLAKISAVLGESVVEVRKERTVPYFNVGVECYIVPANESENTFTNPEHQFYRLPYNLNQ